MYCSSTSPMLSNFKKRFYSSPRPEQQPFLSFSESQADLDVTNTECSERMNDSVAHQQWGTAMAESVCAPGCACPFCVMHSESEEGAEPAQTRSLPSFRSVMEVLYPPSYLGTPSPFPDPPSYSRNDSVAYLTREDDTEVSPLISSAPTSPSHSPPHPLSQVPSLTGVPTPPNRALLTEPGPPGLDSDVPEEPLPAYTRFDQRRPRFPNAFDILGPYPPMSVIRHSVR